MIVAASDEHYSAQFNLRESDQVISPHVVLVTSC